MNETAHLFGTDGSLFGIVTHPMAHNLRRAGVIVLNAGQVHHIGPNRLHVDLARHLASSGFVCARIDQSGKGESATRSGSSRAETLTKDFDETVEYLSSLGVDKFVLLGLCSGADDAMIIADQRPQVVGMVMLDGFVQHSKLSYAETTFRQMRKMSRPDSSPRKLGARLNKFIKRTAAQVDVRDWDAPEVMNAYYRNFIARDGELLAIFTRGAKYYSRPGQLAASLGNSHGITELHLEDTSHTFDKRKDRQHLFSIVSDWIKQKFPQVIQEG